MHYALVSSSAPARAAPGAGSGAPGSPTAAGAAGDAGSSAASNALFEAPGRLRFMDSRSRMFSYKSFGCASLTSEDVGLNEVGSMPQSPTGQRAAQVVGGPSRGHFEAVPEADDEAGASSRQASVAGTPRSTAGGAEQAAAK